MDEVADDLLKLYNGLKTERDGFGGTWRFARWFLIPHKVDDFSARPSDFVGRVRNGTAKLACERLAGSNLSYVMPSHEQWFRWGCRPGDVEDEDRDEADAWYAACTDIALAELTRSNFYTEVYECCSDRAGLGTGRYTAVRGRTGGCCLSPFSLSIAAGCGMKMAGWWCLSGKCCCLLTMWPICLAQVL